MQGYLGLKLGPGLWALICLGLLNKGAEPKAMVPTSSEIPTAFVAFKGTTFGKLALVMASFSSIDPANIEPYIIKPNVTTPGMNIVAA